MPAALPLIGAAFMAVGSVATALGVTLGVAFTVGSLAVTWAAVLTVTGLALMAVSFLAMKMPTPDSAGQQLNTKLDEKLPVPVAYGRTATGGSAIYRQSYGSKNRYLALVVALSVGPIFGVESYAATDVTLPFYADPHLSPQKTPGISGSKLYRDKLTQRWQRGETPAPQTITEASGQALPGSPGKLSGIAHAISVYDYDTDQFPQGLPKNLWTIKGLKVYDPRRDSTYPGGSGSHRRDDHQTWEFSENPYLAALDWTLGRWYNGHKVYGIGARWGEVDVAAFVNGANIADANGWKVGGVVTTGDDKFAVLSTILQAGGGLPISRGAQISVTVNAPKVSTFTLSEADIIGEVEIMNSTSWRDRLNSITPSYREETQLWEMYAGDEITVQQWIAEDAGEKKSAAMELPMVQQAAQAHQIATYDLCNSREFLTLNLTAKVRALSVRVGDAITLNLPSLAINGQKFTVVSRDFNPGNLQVSLALKSETDSKHLFALGQSQTPPASPMMSGYDPSNPGAPDPTAWSIVGSSIEANGVSVPALVIAGENDDPNTAQIVVRYRPVGLLQWATAGSYGKNTRVIEITSVTRDTAYEVSISYLTVRGVLSDPLILTATAGQYSVEWGAGVITGPGKPQDGATVGAPAGTLVAGVPAEQLVEQINNATGVDLFPIFEAIDGVAQIGVRNLTANDRAAAGYRDEAIAHVNELRSDVLADGTNWQSAIDTLTTANGNLQTQITNESSLRSSADAANANAVSIVGAKADQNAAAIIDERNARSDALSAQSTRIAEIEADVGQAQAGITAEQTARATAIAAEATARNQQIANLSNSLGAAVQSEATTRANADGALSTRIDQVSATAADAQSRITTESTARASSLAAVGSRIDTVQANMNATNSTLALVQTTANTTSNRVGSVEAQWGLSVQAGDTVVGMKALASNAGTSQLVFQADAIGFRNPGNGGVARLMEFVNGELRVPSALIGTANIKSANIEDLTIGTNKIALNAVTVTHYAERTSPIFGNNTAQTALTYTLYAPNECDLIVMLSSVQGFSSGDRLWEQWIYCDGAQLNYGGGQKTNDTPCLFGRQRVGPGNHTISANWRGQDSNTRLASMRLIVLEARR